jgi:hypothetical protein
MKISKYQRQKIAEKKQKAFVLYRQGLTTREVGKMVDRSYTWVWKVVKEFEALKNK